MKCLQETFRLFAQISALEMSELKMRYSKQ